MKNNLEKVFYIREFVASDCAFIYSSWLNSFFSNSSIVKGIKKSLFFRNHHDAIERYLVRDGLKGMKVLALIEEPAQIAGYLAHEGDCLHYLFVKDLYRMQGCARMLLEDVSLREFSHATAYMRYLKFDGDYNPYRFYI